MRRAWLVCCLSLLVACSGTPAPRVSPSPPARGTASAAATATPSAAATPSPTPALPAYAIETLRARPAATGRIAVGAVVAKLGSYTKYQVAWESDGARMTGILDIPAGEGPFPVVLVNHGYVPVSQYHVGQDSDKYADPLAAAGILTISPNYPGYAGSGPGTAGVPAIVAEAISDVDLVSELSTLPQADVHRVAVAGHSNGGGVAEILMAADPRVRAAVLYAPVSSDMADNARKWWVHSASSSGGLPSPDVDPTPYALMSPRPHFSAQTPPALLMQGSADEDIPTAWTQATVAALQNAGATVSFVGFPGAMHNFHGADLTRANTLAVDWLRKYLG